MAESTQYQQFLVYAYDLQLRLQTTRNALTQLNSMIEGISITYTVIKELVDKPADQEIILPLGSFAALKAKIPDPNLILISVGQKTLVERDSKTALEFIRKKREELQNQRDKVKKQVDELQTELSKIEPQLEQLQQMYQTQQQNSMQSKSSPQ
jgi:prefoldin alpha subunit